LPERLQGKRTPWSVGRNQEGQQLQTFGQETEHHGSNWLLNPRVHIPSHSQEEEEAGNLCFIVATRHKLLGYVASEIAGFPPGF
jgi:hypothetical protein